MLDSLLEYGRIGRETVGSEEEVVAADLVRDVVELASPPASITFTVSAGFSRIRLERMPLQQVLLNLVTNAIKHHDKPSGNVRIGLAETSDEYVISVADDGPGIAPEFHEDIFQMFTTLPGPGRERNGGLGLAIVRKVLDRCGGRVEVDSSPGRGSTFTVFWPRTPPNPNR